MDPTPRAVRAIITGLLLAAISAGSLVAFLLVAGRDTDESLSVPVVPDRPAAVAAPFVFEDGQEAPPERVLGIRIGPPPTPDRRTEPTVLGTRFRNDEKKNPRTRDEGSSEETPDRGPSCDCDHEQRRSPHGNAYGHSKDKAKGKAVGHRKSRSPGAKGSKRSR